MRRLADGEQRPHGHREEGGNESVKRHLEGHNPRIQLLSVNWLLTSPDVQRRLQQAKEAMAAGATASSRKAGPLSPSPFSSTSASQRGRNPACIGLDRQQDLLRHAEEASANGAHVAPFLSQQSPNAAREAFDKGRVFVLSHGWLTRCHPDPFGTRLLAVYRFFSEHPDEEVRQHGALFWECVQPALKLGAFARRDAAS